MRERLEVCIMMDGYGCFPPFSLCSKARGAGETYIDLIAVRVRVGVYVYVRT